jgi:integrase
MTFRVVHQSSHDQTRCPYRVIVQATGREIDWINQYLDYETRRRLADNTLKSCAHELLHFLRWWESVHHTDAITKEALTESTLLDYVRFQSSQTARVDRRYHQPARGHRRSRLAHRIPDAPGQIAPGFQQTYWQRAPMGIGRPRLALSRLRERTPKRTRVPLSIDEVARFWSSFRTARDLAIVALMLLQGLRSQEVLDLNRDDLVVAGSADPRARQGQQDPLPSVAPEGAQLLARS